MQEGRRVIGGRNANIHIRHPKFNYSTRRQQTTFEIVVGNSKLIGLIDIYHPPFEEGYGYKILEVPDNKRWEPTLLENSGPIFNKREDATHDAIEIAKAIFNEKITSRERNP